MSSPVVHPPSHEGTTLSTLSRAAAQDEDDSAPSSPSTHPSAGPANPTLFSLLSTLALNDQDDHDSSVSPTSTVDVDGLLRSSPDEFDMAPERRWEGHDESQLKDGAHTASAITADEEDEEDDDFVGSLPNTETLDKHAVFSRTPSFDSSDLTKRLAQLSVSDLATRPHPMIRQASFGDRPGTVDVYTDEEKMEAIIEQFGAIDTGSDKPESFLYEGKGGILREVLCVGNLHLTTHRFTFHAVLPPLALLDSSSSASSLIIKSGPVWIHRPGRLTKKRRVWLELGIDMMSTFPDSSKEGRTRPLKSLILSSILDIAPPDPEDPLSIGLMISSDKEVSARMEFDTLESTLEWRREISGALWHSRRMRLHLARKQDAPGSEAATAEAEAGAQAAGYGKQEDWERIKISIPLDRIVEDEVADYMGFATLLNLDIFTSDHGPCPLSAPLSPQSSTSSLPVDHDSMLRLQFALLSYQTPFITQFQRALAAARTRREIGSTLSCPPLVQMDGVFKEEIEIGRREDDEQHHHEPEAEDAPKDIESAGKATNARLRITFGLKEGETLWSTTCGLQRSIIPLRGHLIISPRYIGFYRHTIAGHDIKYRFLLGEVKGAVKAPTLHLSTKGLGLQVMGHADTTFEFWSKSSRNEAIDKINAAVAGRGAGTPAAESGISTPVRPSTPTTPVSPPIRSPMASSFSSAGSTTLGGGRSSSPHRASSFDILGASHDPKMAREKAQAAIPESKFMLLPKVVNLDGPRPVDPTERKRIQPRHVVMLTIGSRGDVQPYIALGLGLKKDGHRCTIVTHDEFKPWIESFGIEHRQAGGDPEALMKLSVQHKMFSPGFFKESLGGFRQWLDDLFHDSWVACQDADVLIESPSVFAGIHIAEGLGIPYFRAFTMTWTRTQTYPQAFLVPPFEMSGSFNYSTYVMFDSIIWKAMSGQINKWRKKDMGLGPTDQSHLHAMDVPFVYNFSSSVVPHPIDWKDNIYISGYWFLDDSDPDWSPPASLDAFIKRARDDGKALVYIGFGSIVVPHPAAMTRSIIKAVQKADVRAIIAKGWSDRGGEVGKDGQPIVVEMPEDCCYSVAKVPHDWLFTQIDAAVHHGGAGTTGASLRAGLPTIIKPWFGDQFFWGNRVASLGCGIKLTDLHSNDLAAALTRATTDRVMREAAAKIGEKIRAEKGVDNAIAWMYSYLGRAGDRHASYKPTPGTISHSTAVHQSGTSSPKGHTTTSPFKTAALTSVAGAKLHALVAKTSSHLREGTSTPPLA